MTSKEQFDSVIHVLKIIRISIPVKERYYDFGKPWNWWSETFDDLWGICQIQIAIIIYNHRKRSVKRITIAFVHIKLIDVEYKIIIILEILPELGPDIVFKSTNRDSGIHKGIVLFLLET